MVDYLCRPAVASAFQSATQHFGTNPTEILSHRRCRNMVAARAYIARQLYTPKGIYSLATVGRILNKTHKTVRSYLQTGQAATTGRTLDGVINDALTENSHVGAAQPRNGGGI